MKLFYIRRILQLAFKNHGSAKISGIHQSEKGWECVLEDTINGDCYICKFFPITSTKTVVPRSADELLNLNQEKGEM